MLILERALYAAFIAGGVWVGIRLSQKTVKWLDRDRG